MPEQDTSKPYPDGVAAIFEIARRLRAPDGCPWDREQTHESLRPYLLEETYELLETIDRGDDDGKLLEELGDVLLQVAMHAAIAGEQGRFDAARVSEAAAVKMVARHPHVFGDTEVSSAEEVLRNWEQQKAVEAARAGNGDQTVLDRVPPTLPALAWTLNMQKRAARVGFDVDSAVDARARVAERAGEVRSSEELGDLLLDVVGLARKLRINPEDALRAAGQRYRDRFARMDREVTRRGASYRDLEPAQQLELWEEAR